MVPYIGDAVVGFQTRGLFGETRSAMLRPRVRTAGLPEGRRGGSDDTNRRARMSHGSY